MTFKPFMIAVLMAIALSLANFTPFAFADGNSDSNLSSNQSNQSLNQPSMLVAPPSFKINVYPQPGIEKQRVGYGLGGDRVIVLEQVGSNEGFIWKHVQFTNSSKLKGWIREEFVAPDVQKNTQKKRQSQNGSNQQGSFLQDQGYLGDRQKQYPESQQKTHYRQQ